MDYGLRRDVIFTPYGSRHGPAFFVHSHNIKLISPGTLDRGDLEAQEMALLPGTLDVNYTHVS
jgi:hypothetical protein